MPTLIHGSVDASPSEPATHQKNSGTNTSAGIWKIRNSVRRLTIATASIARANRPASPPISCQKLTRATA